MLGPVRLEEDLRDLAMVRPGGGDTRGALGAAATQQHHLRIFRAHLFQRGPDALAVVAVGAASKCDPRARKQEDLSLCELSGVDEVAAVDHRRGQRPVVDKRSRARPPRRAGLGHVDFSERGAEEFKDVAALGERQALGDQTLKLGRADFRAVLLGLRPAPRCFVVVEVARDAIGLAVEEIDEGPQEIREIGFEPRVGEEIAKRLGRRVEGERPGVGRGQGARIGFVLEGAIAVQGEFVEEMLRRRIWFMIHAGTVMRALRSSAYKRLQRGFGLTAGSP